MTHITNAGEVDAEYDDSTNVETRISKYVLTDSDKYFVNNDSKYKY